MQAIQTKNMSGCVKRNSYYDIGSSYSRKGKDIYRISEGCSKRKKTFCQSSHSKLTRKEGVSGGL